MASKPKITKAYKVLRSVIVGEQMVLRSCIESAGAMDYARKAWNIPAIAHSRLFVFRSRRAAVEFAKDKRYLGDLVVFACEADEAICLRNTAFFSTLTFADADLRQFKDFWQSFEKYQGTEDMWREQVSSTPEGTLGAKRVRLLEQVSGLTFP